LISIGWCEVNHGRPRINPDKEAQDPGQFINAGWPAAGCALCFFENRIGRMNSSAQSSHVPGRHKKVLGSLLIGLLLYLLSTGPVAWATNDAYHPAYLPDEVWWFYLPLGPLMRVEWINSAFFFYTAVLWDGFPAGYTTL
jgi:hypothetical protein